MLSSLAQVALLVAAAFLPNAHAAATVTSDCTLAHRGYLAAGPDPRYGFTLNSKNQLAYTDAGTKTALYVEYQACKSLAPRNPDNKDVPGRFYVPSKKKCLKVTNQADATGPYYAALAPCDTTPPFRFNQRGNQYYFLGKTDEEGTDPQGGCGLLGYKANSKGTPITGADHKASIVCKGKPFQVVLP